jgi:hypothetical protein
MSREIKASAFVQVSSLTGQGVRECKEFSHFTPNNNFVFDTVIVIGAGLELDKKEGFFAQIKSSFKK